MDDPRAPRRAKLSPAAEAGIRDALLWSHEHFGAAAAERHASPIRQAIRDVGSDPFRPGSRTRPELPGGVRTYHLYFSRARVPRESPRVRRPRHLLVYRCSEDSIEVIRLLPDARELERHLPDLDGD